MGNTRLRVVRQDCGWSQKGLACRLGISQPALSRIEDGKQKLDFCLAVEISKLLSCKLDDLVFEPEIPFTWEY